MSGRDGWNNPELKPFREEIEAILGGEAPLFWAAMDGPALSALRINGLRAGAGGAAQAFSAGRVPWEEMGRYVRSALSPAPIRPTPPGPIICRTPAPWLRPRC